jgi:hypothetical protein
VEYFYVLKDTYLQIQDQWITNRENKNHIQTYNYTLKSEDKKNLEKGRKVKHHL